MKYLLAVLVLLFSVTAFAVDSDGDGVQDVGGVVYSTSFDDSMPGWTLSGFVKVSSSHTPPYAIAQPCFFSCSSGTATFSYNAPYRSVVSFWTRGSSSQAWPMPFLIDSVQVGSVYSTPAYERFNRTVDAGLHTFQWNAPGSFRYYIDDFSITTVTDNCPTVANSNQLDTDGDAQGDVCDTDDDNDGVLDIYDSFPLDTDNDGIDNSADNDDDNDGYADTYDKFPVNASASSDTDSDGFPDYWNQSCDITCQTNSGLTLDNCFSSYNPEQTNTDGDAQGNACDADDDNDGVADAGDAYPLDPLLAGDIDGDGVDGFVDNCPANSNANQLNTDGDAQGDVCDTDDDNDGVSDASDQFPLNAAASSDTDVDGFPGSWNAACDITCQNNSGLTLDNCPTTANANQLNTDGDAQGDVCDTDDDNDGVADASDKFPLDPTEWFDTDNDGIGNNADTDDDNDGMPDVWETTYGFNSLVNDANSDADNDGITNLQEYVNGSNPTTVVTVKNDYNNDGIAGWYWKGDAGDVATKNEIWQLTFPLQSSGWGVPTRLYPPNFVDQPNWEIVTSGDFNKDGDADVLWRNKSTAQWRVWQIQNGTRVAQTQLADFDLAHEWQVIGAGDTDKDGDDDVVLNNTTTGEVLIWQMQNHDITTTNSVGTKVGYTLNRVGDFNKDGDVDLLFREIGTDALVIWEINSNAFVAEYSLGNTGTGYSPACAGDFDADGDDDIMLFSTSTQEKWIIVENHARTGQKFGSTNSGFAFISCGDYDGDGDMDTVWRRTADNLTRVVLQQGVLTTPVKQTVYTNPYGGVDIGSDGYGFVYRGNSN